MHSFVGMRLHDGRMPPATKNGMRSFTSVQMFHTHTPRQAGLLSEENARQSKRSETDAARQVRQDQEVELSSQSRIANWVSRSGAMLRVVVDPVLVRSGRLAEEVAPEEVN